MPTYEYDCPKHGRFEAITRISDRHNVNCPECGMIANMVVTGCNFRVANPVKWISPEGTVIAEKPDSGIRPPAGQPYPVGG